MSGDTPRLTAAMAQTVVDLINDGDVTEFTDEESAAIAAVQAIASGTHVVVDAADARDAARYRWLRQGIRPVWIGADGVTMPHFTRIVAEAEADASVDAALAAAEGKERD